MLRYLIDANLPYRFSLWHGDAFLHVFDLGDDMPDSAIWEYARDNNLCRRRLGCQFRRWQRRRQPPRRRQLLAPGALVGGGCLGCVHVCVWARSALGYSGGIATSPQPHCPAALVDIEIYKKSAFSPRPICAGSYKFKSILVRPPQRWASIVE